MITNVKSDASNFSSSIYNDTSFVKNRYGSQQTRASKLYRPEFINNVIDDTDFESQGVELAAKGVLRKRILVLLKCVNFK